MYQLKNKRVLLGITGGIAAYKAAILVRLLRQYQADVRVVMTQSACEFITPLTLQALSGREVHSDLLDPAAEAAMGHIELARWADVIVVAPASANFMAKLGHGIADDLLSTLCLASEAPILLAPAMNHQMWMNSATQANYQTLLARNISMSGPDSGDQACGENGPGRMREPEEIIKDIGAMFNTGVLSGSRLLITAGPTREAIDPVRYISNKSSGKMGLALANAAIEAGADVSLVSGPIQLDFPEHSHVNQVLTANEMHQAVMQQIAHTDIFIAAAAVADYRIDNAAQHKIKKTSDELQLNLKKNPDILASVAAIKDAPFTVGFAAETQNLEVNALAKLKAKQIDMIAANRVGDQLGFDSDENALNVYWEDGSQQLPQTHKNKLARDLIALVAERYHAKNSNQTH